MRNAECVVAHRLPLGRHPPVVLGKNIHTRQRDSADLLMSAEKVKARRRGRPLRSLDLFSGVGGMTLALEGYARPVAYCEVNSTCQKVLQARILDGSLPKAPILGDVREVTAASLKGQAVDIIVGGWPCQDLSTIGLLKGLSGARSGLISEVIRLTDEFRPPALFLENVPTVISLGMDHVVDEFVKKRGYELRWAVVSASSVGAPHLRRRWFGLLVRPGTEIKLPGSIAPRGWKPTSWAREPVARLQYPKDAKERRSFYVRFGMLGNSVVPECVRAAFVTLASCFRVMPTPGLLTDRRTVIALPQAPAEGALREHRASSRYSAWGMLSPSTGAFELASGVPDLKKPDLRIVLDPRAYRASEKLVNPVTAELVTERVTLDAWPTPRHRGFGPASHVLTHRDKKDLPTALRFSVDTPPRMRAGLINPQFAEWLMGYPIDWTLIDGDYSRR